MEKLKQKIPGIIMLVAGMGLGVMVGMYASRSLPEDAGLLAVYARMGLYLLTAVVIYYLQIIIHEAGHLVFGLLSGYSFVSFRIGSLILIRQNGKYHLRHYSMAGTGGQCLLSPPDYNDGNFPCILYNLGGVIFNLIAALICFLIPAPNPLIGFILSTMVLFGITMVLSNGIPLQSDLVSNDGYNALNLKKDKNAVRAFWVSLKINAMQMEGIHLKDMDPALFELPEDADLKNPLISTILIVKENRFMDQGDLDAAAECARVLLSDRCRLNGIHENLLKLDVFYMAAMENGKNTSTAMLEEKAMDRFLKAVKSTPSAIRTQLVKALVQGDKEKAAAAQDALKQLEKTYPYAGDLETENELVQTAIRRFAQDEQPAE